jgi:hypothetical protein
MIMWRSVYYERKAVILQSVVFINRISKIIHYLALSFHKRLNQDEDEVFWGLNFWRISSIEL